MKKYKELLKNIGVLTLSNFGSKLLSFFLIPLYTAVLTTEEYGNFDFISVTISLLIPLLTINIAEGAWRYLLDEKLGDDKKKQICGISFKITIYSIIFVFVLICINNYFNISLIVKNYSIYFILYYAVSVLYQFAQNITRGFDRLNNIAISGIINSILMLSLNLLFLLVFDLKLDGYFLSNILANIISTIYLFLSAKIHRNLRMKNDDQKLKKELTDYSKPLMLNSIGWWVNSVSDRYVVTFICGVAANGIYSIAYKIPSIMSIIQSIFNQSWTISATKNLKDKNSTDYFNNIYKYYNLIMVASCSILIIFSKLLARLMYLNEFYVAWKYMPFLMIALVFGGLSGVLGGMFSAVKDSKIMGKTTIIGAIVNIFGNIVLVYNFGVIGAAISTAFSYFIVWVIRINYLKKYINLSIEIKKDLLVYCLLIIQAILLLVLDNNIVLYSLQLLIFGFEILFYSSDVLKIMKKIKFVK